MRTLEPRRSQWVCAGLATQIDIVGQALPDASTNNEWLKDWHSLTYKAGRNAMKFVIEQHSDGFEGSEASS